MASVGTTPAADAEATGAPTLLATVGAIAVAVAVAAGGATTVAVTV
jgi:hypothetical protein